jgi:hypothetical protein
MQRTVKLLSVGVLMTAMSCAVVGTTERPGSPRITDLGGHQWPISTTSPEAQALFNQGIQLVYAFDHSDAARAFRAAIEKDPACAMCEWALALARGPNVNNANPRNREGAQQHQARAERLVASKPDSVTPLERALIAAATGRYVTVEARTKDKSKEPVAAMCTAGRKEPAPAFDMAYAQRMAAVYKEFGTHPDVATLYADAEMITDAWYWWNRDGKPTAATANAVAALEGVVKSHPNHTGSNHLLIHVLEQSPKPERADAAAQLLRTLAPGAPHLLHMPSHIDIRVGRFAEAVAANQAALLADDRREETVKAQGYTPRRGWRSHHLHFLQYAAAIDGQQKLAIESAEKLAARSSDGEARESLYSQYRRVLAPLNHARFGDWRAVLASPAPSVKDGLEAGFNHYLRGLAHNALGDSAAAERELAELRRIAALPKNREAKLYDLYRISDDILQIAVQALAGTIDLRAKRVDDGIAALRRAHERERAIDADDPPLFGAHTSLMLIEALLSQSRFAEAEVAARDALKEVRGNGWTLNLLHRALVAQGKSGEAVAVKKELDAAWRRADPALRKS